ncbi:DUF192 domain-containing protein [Legionella sp. km772]|uniref:DUF192 domain-containing protein n=1 Tax=Legionella sp. km772 TaxID=2498111 RepID=UPI000F8ED4E8|nr:DUF192 domain-containing protein [Legionella sp. km772]RUR07958.1 DUF192 domain-containing protein [Legionella sp. km772]
MVIKNFNKLVISLLMSMPLITQAMETMTVSINKHPFYLEVPETQSEYNRGLMYRHRLAESGGMIFVFDPKSTSQPTMWMKNTYLPLDMLFIGPDYRIKCILEHTKPLSTVPLSCDNSVLAVIELNAGEVSQFELKTGMEIQGQVK